MEKHSVLKPNGFEKCLDKSRITHYTITEVEFLAHRPIKPAYIRQLVQIIEEVEADQT